MARKKKKPKLIENIEVVSIADKGRAVGRHEGKVVFVEGAVPGDIVDVLVYKSRSSHMEAKVKTLLKPSEDRVEPFCKHFGVCGGCKWQHLSYAAQIHHKQMRVENALSRLGQLDLEQIDVRQIIPAQDTQFYRNKLHFSMSNKNWITEEEVKSGVKFSHRNAVGFHRPGAFDKVVDIDKCYLQPDPSNKMRNAVREFALENDYTFYDIRNQEGLLRNMVVRITTLGEVMVIFALFEDDVPKRKALLDFMLEKFPEITSLYYVINPKQNDFLMDLDMVLYHGNSHVYEMLGDYKFKISPKSFFQTNSKQAVKLYDVIVDFAEFKGTENVYDLYTGTGSIACYVAKRCKQVVGIEEVAFAIDDAQANAAINDIDNTVFYVGDVKDILTEEFAVKHGKADILITDPPRAGMHPKVLKMLLKLEVPKIIYVSCKPSTQARDLQMLSGKYDVLKIQPVDMFPHTHHIENVALLQLNEKYTERARLRAEGVVIEEEEEN